MAFFFSNYKWSCTDDIFQKRYPEFYYLNSYEQKSLFLPLLSGTRRYFSQDSLISSCFDVRWGGQFEQQISFTNLISVSQAHLIMLLKAEQNHWVGNSTWIKWRQCWKHSVPVNIYRKVTLIFSPTLCVKRGRLNIEILIKNI